MIQEAVLIQVSEINTVLIQVAVLMLFNKLEDNFMKGCHIIHTHKCTNFRIKIIQCILQ